MDLNFTNEKQYFIYKVCFLISTISSSKSLQTTRSNMFLNKLLIGALTNMKFLLITLAVLIFYKIFIYVRRIRSLPPGPWGLPIIGYLPFLKGDAHISFKNLSNKYGPIFSTKLGDQLIVVLSDYRHIREAFRKEEFSGRPHTELSSILGGYGK